MSTSSDLPSTSASSGAALLVAAAAAAAAGPDRRRPDAPGSSACRVPGCTEPLVGGYNQKYKICRTHFGAASFRLDDGRPHRFCQQCSRIQPLEDFDGNKLSCRMGLARHTQRRKERQARLAAGEPGGGARAPARRAQRAKRAHQEAAPPSPSSGHEAALPGSSGGSASDDGSQGRHQRRCLSPAPACEQSLALAVPESAPMAPAPVHQHQPQPGPEQQLKPMSAGQWQQHEMLTVLLARQAQPLLTLAQPAPAVSALQAPAAVQPSAAVQPTIGHKPAPLLAVPPPAAAVAVAVPPCALPPLLLPASRPLDPIPSLMLAPVTPHQSLTPDDLSPACSEPLPTAQPGGAPRAAELLLRLLVMSLQQRLQAQPPHPPSSTAGFSFGAPAGSLSLPLPPPDSPIGASRRSAFRRWRPPAAAGAAQQTALLLC